MGLEATSQRWSRKIVIPVIWPRPQTNLFGSQKSYRWDFWTKLKGEKFSSQVLSTNTACLWVVQVSLFFHWSFPQYPCNCWKCVNEWRLLAEFCYLVAVLRRWRRTCEVRATFAFSSESANLWRTDSKYESVRSATHFSSNKVRLFFKNATNKLLHARAKSSALLSSFSPLSFSWSRMNCKSNIFSNYWQTLHKFFYLVPRNKSLGHKTFEHFVEVFSREFWPDNFNEQNSHQLDVRFICASEISSI